MPHGSASCPGVRTRFGAVKSMLTAIHVSMGDTSGQVDNLEALFHANVWGDLVLQGVSYAFGMYCAVVIWRPVIRWRHKARGDRFSGDESVQPKFAMRTYTDRM